MSKGQSSGRPRWPGSGRWMPARLRVVLVALVVAATAAGGVALGQGGTGDGPAGPVPVESVAPAWRDLERARNDRELAWEVRDVIQTTLDRTVADLALELDRVEALANDEAGKALLRAEARQLVIQEYMAGGAVEDLAFVLEVADATDALWRHTLLSEVSEVVDQALNSVDHVPEELERTKARIDRLRDTIPHLNSRLEDAVQSVEAAEWVVYIAEINDLADRELADNGWREPTERQWYNLRWCESRNNYTIESSNGLFYGAYQFEPRTWRTVGGTGNPAHAPPEEQDARARLLYARRGAQPWPRDYCGRWLP